VRTAAAADPSNVGRRAAAFATAVTAALALAAPTGAGSVPPIVLKQLDHEARGRARVQAQWSVWLYRRLHSLDLHLPDTTRPAAAPKTPAGAGPRSLSVAETTILERINAVRVRYGLRPLTVSAGLNAAARQHSLEMVRRGYFAHESADGTSFDRRIRRYYLFRSAGENIAFGCPDLSAAEAMKLWLESPPHRRNILTARFREIGISLVHVAAAPGREFQGDPTTVVTTDFGSR
jgi:uncharacterized protein YkwD